MAVRRWVSWCTPGRYLVVFFLLASSGARAAEPPLGELVQALTGPDQRARAVARQLLPRKGVEAVAAMIPLLTSEDPAIAKASFDILMDIGNEAATPGREADRKEVTDQFMVLVEPDRPEKERIIGLRLLERLVPPRYDVAPMAAMLKDKPMLRDKARAALQRIGTQEARAALRAALDGADAEFQCALVNSLRQLQDEASLEAIKSLTRSEDAAVRVAAARALAWTGDPSNLKWCTAVLNAADEDTGFDALDALLQLTDAIAEKGGNWQIAVKTYLDILKTGEGVLKDAALAGLGRIGDGTCVQPILDALENADVRTWLSGVDALRKMQGVDVTRRIVEVYPTLPERTRLALLGVLGEKKTPHALSVLQQAARSSDPAFRRAALEAFGTSGMAEGLENLIAAAHQGSDEEKTIARRGILDVADALRAGGKKGQAGRAYLAALEAATAGDLRTRALEGITACPDPRAYDAVMAAADDKDLKEPATRALIAVAARLTTAGERNKALQAYEKVRQMGGSAETTRLVAKQMRELGADVDVTAMLGVVTHWWVVGPFELGDDNKGWNTDYIGEPNVKLDASYTSGNRKVVWKHVASRQDDGKVDLRADVADRDQCIAYAYTEITVDAETQAVLLVGADDSEKIWVNGKQVLDLFVARPLKVDQDRVPVRLKAGTNAVLLKIWQNNLAWEFCVRVTAPDGFPIAFAQKTK